MDIKFVNFRPDPTFPRCEISGKVKYPSLKDAKTTLNSLKSRRGKHAAERVYLCEDCKGYHLTHFEAPLGNKRTVTLLHEEKFRALLEKQNNEPLP
jgi:hypothetical protein